MLPKVHRRPPGAFNEVEGLLPEIRERLEKSLVT